MSGDESWEKLIKEVEDHKPYVPIKNRKRNKLDYHKELSLNEDKEMNINGNLNTGETKKSLFDEYTKEKLHFNGKIDQRDSQDMEVDVIKILQEEEDILQSVAENTALMGAKEIATGTIYTKPLSTSWKPPKYTKVFSGEEISNLYNKFNVRAEGNSIPMMLTNFKEMRLCSSIVNALKKKGIDQPTPIQMQGIPSVLSGRDIIAIAHTGSGKSLVFIIPLILFVMEQEYELPFKRNEGPYGLIIVPARELAKQIYDNIIYLTDAVSKRDKIKISTTLCIGGEPLGNNISSLSNGTHIVVATPGRLLALLKEQVLTLDICRYLCMDEADRMIDLKFEEEIRAILAYFKDQRQTLLFSATMPKKIQNFAKSALVDPITINIGRPGAASSNIIQDVVYVRDEDKLASLLDILQKTAPPVLIFAMKKTDVDYIHEYLLLKGVEAVGIHGDKAQTERHKSIDDFKSNLKDVLVATDIASKGLDFPNIQHVINYDMPPDIENYVHRIGRTGRHNKKGVATTLISKSSGRDTELYIDGPVLLDLKHLLIEAKQNVPEFLANLKDHNSLTEFYDNDSNGCAFCGGLGHRIAECTKLESIKAKKLKENEMKTFNSTHHDW